MSEEQQTDAEMLESFFGDRPDSDETTEVDTEDVETEEESEDEVSEEDAVDEDEESEEADDEEESEDDSESDKQKNKEQWDKALQKQQQLLATLEKKMNALDNAESEKEKEKAQKAVTKAYERLQSQIEESEYVDTEKVLPEFVKQVSERDAQQQETIASLQKQIDELRGKVEDTAVSTQESKLISDHPFLKEALPDLKDKAIARANAIIPKSAPDGVYYEAANNILNELVKEAVSKNKSSDSEGKTKKAKVAKPPVRKSSTRPKKEVKEESWEKSAERFFAPK